MYFWRTFSNWGTSAFCSSSSLSAVGVLNSLITWRLSLRGSGMFTALKIHKTRVMTSATKWCINYISLTFLHAGRWMSWRKRKKMYISATENIRDKLVYFDALGNPLWLFVFWNATVVANGFPRLQAMQLTWWWAINRNQVRLKCCNSPVETDKNTKAQLWLHEQLREWN